MWICLGWGGGERGRRDGGRLTQMWLGRSNGMLGFRVCEQICVRWVEGLFIDVLFCFVW